MLRDYQKNPLGYIQNGSVRKREKPFKEDIIELYIDKNMSTKECAEYFQYNMRMFQKVLAEYGITKDRKQVYEKQKETLLKTKGVENVFQLKEVQEKSKQTSLEKYGKEHYVQTDEYKEKNLETRKEKYGDDPFQREKYRQTCLEKFGVENYDYINYTEEQLKLLDDKEYCENYIKENNIQSALEFSKISGIKQFASLTLLHKHDLFNMFEYKISKEEKEIQEFLKENNIEYKTHFKMSNNQEIDIYIPSKNIGIEYNGDIWHCEIFRPEKYHYNKSIYALENYNIFVYHIFGYEWNNIKDKIINQLNNLLGLNTNKIYARKCDIKEVSKKDKKHFLDMNHIQGNDHSLLYLGLYYQDELVSLMTFSKPHNTNKIEWELSRFCSKAGSNVIGGASKLFKYFINKYNPQSIISYSNIAHTKGKLYETLGFQNTHLSKPGYVWIKSGSMKSRYQTRTKNLLKKGFEGSESEIMHNMGYSKLYDCGNKVWVWKNNT